MTITPPTTKQTALLTELSPANVNLTKNATDEDLAALRRGEMSLNALAPSRIRPNVHFNATAGMNAIMAEMDAIKTGIDALKVEIERMTAPEAVAAE